MVLWAKSRFSFPRDEAQHSSTEIIGFNESAALPWREPWDTNSNQMGTWQSGALLGSAAQRKSQGWIIKLALINISYIWNVFFCSLVNSDVMQILLSEFQDPQLAARLAPIQGYMQLWRGGKWMILGYRDNKIGCAQDSYILRQGRWTILSYHNKSQTPHMAIWKFHVKHS